MNVELNPEAALRVESEVASGRLNTAQDAIDDAVALAQVDRHLDAVFSNNRD